jgi:sugar lactone lactonase YvrE
LGFSLVVGLAFAGCSKNGGTEGGNGDGPSVGDYGNPGDDPTDGGTGVVTGSDGGTTCPPKCPTNPTGFHRTEQPNPIPAENAKKGDPYWRSGRQAYAHKIDVYTSLDSAQAGDTIGVKVSTDGAADTVNAQVYRLGYYGGAGARLIWSGGPYDATTQDPCVRDTRTSLVECHWKDTLTFQVGDDWVSGFYVVKITRGDGFMRMAPFVVRDDRAAEILFQAAMNTYQAYNAWGGESLYADASRTMPKGRAWEVSYDRPYDSDDGTGQMLRYEFPFIQTMEKYGYDVTYVTNLDFDRFSNLLDGIGEFVIAGHDEYWTQAERDQVDVALQKKSSVLHFAANGGYWRVRTVSNTAGKPLRTIVCYKNEQEQDPDQPGSTVEFAQTDKPENALWGARYDSWELIGFPLIVRDPNHWLFEGTGLKAGTLLHGLMGYEYDNIQDNGFTPQGLEVPIHSPAVSAEGVPSKSDLVSRTLPGGNIVFSAGTIYWSYGLKAGTELYDPRVVRMTLNVLEKGLKNRRPPRVFEPMTDGPSGVPAPSGCWAKSVGAFAGVASDPQHTDGSGSTAHFEGPTGIAVAKDGRVFVADTVGNRIRMIGTDAAHTVTTIAGTGDLGYRDGAGSSAMFRRPNGLVIGVDGALYVADSDNHNIRRVETTPPYNVTTLAGGARVPGAKDGVGTNALFNRPTALAVDATGNLYVADQVNSMVRRIDVATHAVSTIAGSGLYGWQDGDGKTAQFNNPSAIAVGTDGTVYVYDAGNQRLVRIDKGATGGYSVKTIAGATSGSTGFADGVGSAARFRAQMGLTALPDGSLLLADTANFRIRKIVPGADADSTQVCTFAGSGNSGGTLGAAQTSDVTAPSGLAALPDGRVVVSDSFYNTLRVISP